MTKIIETAYNCVKLGFNPIPMVIDSKGKHAAIESWKEWQSKLMTVDQVDKSFNLNTTALAIVTGKVSNLYSIDFDDRFSDDFMKFILNNTIPAGKFNIVETKRGYHFNFYCSVKKDRIGYLDYRTSMYHVEIGGDGRMILMPPSKNGDFEYKYIMGSLDSIPIITDDQFWGIINKLKLLQRTSGILDLVVKEWKPGARNAILLGLSGFCRKTLGLSESEVLILVEFISIQCKDMDNMAKRYGTVKDTYKKPEAEISTFKWLNEVRDGFYNELLKVSPVSQKLPIIPPSEKPKKDIKPKSFQDLIQIASVPTQWIVEPLIPMESVVVFAAKSASFKTFLMLDMAYAISDGRLWLDRFTTKSVGVLYIDEESGEGRLGERSKQLADIAKVYPNIYFLSHAGLKFNGTNGDHELLKEWLKAHPEIKLVVIDTFRRVTQVNEDDASEVSNFLTTYIRPLVSDLKLTVIIIHHTRKRQQGSTITVDDEMDEIRGSSDITNYADLVLMIKRYRGQDNQLILKQVKSRYKEELPDQMITIEDDKRNNKIKFVCNGTPSDHTKVSDCAKKIYEWMMEGITYQTSQIEEEMAKLEFREQIVKLALNMSVKNKSVIRESRGIYKKSVGGLVDYVEGSKISHPERIDAICDKCGTKTLCKLNTLGRRVCPACWVEIP